MDDSYEPELGHLLEGDTAPASAETLRTIVARGRRGRERVLTGALLLALIGGPLAGYLVARSGHDGDGTQQVAVAASPEVAAATLGAPEAPGAPGPEAPPGPGMQPVTARNTADGVRLRLFLTDLPKGAPKKDNVTLPDHCFPTRMLDVELSTDAAIGRAQAAQWSVTPPPAPISLAGMAFTGLAERAPVFTVIVRTADSVKTVRLVLDDGATDAMAPVQGWAALAHALDPSLAVPQQDANGKFVKLAPPSGHVDALDAGGKVIGSASFSDMGKAKPQLPADCVPPQPPNQVKNAPPPPLAPAPPAPVDLAKQSPTPTSSASPSSDVKEPPSSTSTSPSSEVKKAPTSSTSTTSSGVQKSAPSSTSTSSSSAVKTTTTSSTSTTPSSDDTKQAG